MLVKAMELLEMIAPEDVSLKTYLMSIVFMPRALQILCLTNLFCWSSFVCYSLYFTDFVGQAVFRGNPTAEGQYNVENVSDTGKQIIFLTFLFFVTFSFRTYFLFKLASFHDAVFNLIKIICYNLYLIY